MSSQNKELETNISVNEWLIDDYPPLTGEVGKAAVNGQTVLYPKVVRSMVDPPVVNQVYANMSLMLFKEPRKLSNGKYAYGFMKNRGNWATDGLAKIDAGRIIKNIDSKYPVRIMPVGHWLPITEETAFIKEQIDVKTHENEITLRGDAEREKDAERRRIMKEIRDREDEVKKGDIYDDPESLTYYSMRRVTEIKLNEAIAKQKLQIETINEKIVDVRKELKSLQLRYPNYKDEWIERYNVERRKGGIPDYTPSEDQLEKFDEDLEKISVEDENNNNADE